MFTHEGLKDVNKPVKIVNEPVKIVNEPSADSFTLIRRLRQPKGPTHRVASRFKDV